MGKPSFSDLSVWPDRLLSSGELPDLSAFLGPESWLLFNKLGFSDVEMEWLMLDPSDWHKMSCFVRFQDFVKNLDIVNDSAERGVGLVKMFIGSLHNEDSYQDNLLSVAEHRKIVKKNSTKEELASVGVKKSKL